MAVHNPAQLEPFTDLIADELNVKAVELTDDIAAYGRFELTVNARAAGPRIGKDVQAAIKAVKAGGGVVNDDGTLTAGPARLLPEEYSSKLVLRRGTGLALRPCRTAPGLVVLDGTVTPELEAEGWPRTASANCRTCASRAAWMCWTGSVSRSRFRPTNRTGP